MDRERARNAAAKLEVRTPIRLHFTSRYPP